MDKIEQLQDLIDQSQRIVFFGGGTPPTKQSLILNI